MSENMEPKGAPMPPQESERKKFEGAQEWGDLVNVVGEVSKGIDDIILHAERIFRTYDMGSPFADKKADLEQTTDLEVLKKAGKIVQEIKDRIEMKGHY